MSLKTLLYFYNCYGHCRLVIPVAPVWIHLNRLVGLIQLTAKTVICHIHDQKAHAPTSAISQAWLHIVISPLLSLKQFENGKMQYAVKAHQGPVTSDGTDCSKAISN